MELQRWDLAPYAMGWEKNDDGEVCMSYDVQRLEESHAKMVELLKEARHVCAYPDMNTVLLAEIDTLLKEMGETNLPELH